VIREIETPQGTARALVQQALQPKGALVLGHGAGGSVSAPDLQAATRVALEEDWTVALVEQPYRVAGRSSAPPAPRLDEAWTAVVDDLQELRGLPLITGGRSSGARVACRTAEATGAAGVLCLAFPLQPPKGESRLAELEEVRVPVLVVQGRNDRFGVPPEAPGRTVVVVDGDHALKKDLAGVGEAVRAWLRARSS
jgi:predicted alpha/beta-hydrolase family hydrolase